MDQVPDPATPIPGHDNTADEAAVRAMQHQVDLLHHYSNTPELLSDFRRTVDAMTTITVEEDEPDVSWTAPGGSDWRVKDRLTPAEIDQLVDAFKYGATIPELVTRYGICRSSIKTLLRQRGVRRTRGCDPA